LKAQIGSPTVEVMPADLAGGDAMAEALTRFGTPIRGGRGSLTVQLPGGETQLAELVRVLDAAGLHVASLHLHQPSLDDVFLAKTGRKLEGAADDLDDEQAAEKPARGRRRRRG
jgi:ABC-2 type transport system ATP-binding protein